MRQLGLATRGVIQRCLALAFLLAITAPALVWAQPDSVTTESRSSTSTTTTTTTTEWISDWRLWALVGAVLLVIIVIAATRGRGEGGDRTTVVK